MTFFLAALTSITVAVAPPHAGHSRSGAAYRSAYHSQPRFEWMGDFGIGSPTGLLGTRIGYTNGTRWGVEVGAGIGLTGYQTSLMGRLYQLIGDQTVALSLGVGPSLALNGPVVGRSIEHLESIDTRGRLYYATWMNVESAAEVRLPDRGLFFRAALGVSLTMKENMSPLCRGVVFDANNNPPNVGCESDHFEPGPEYVAKPASVYLTGTVGWRY